MLYHATVNEAVLSGGISVYDVAKRPPNGTYVTVGQKRRQNWKNSCTCVWVGPCGPLISVVVDRDSKIFKIFESWIKIYSRWILANYRSRLKNRQSSDIQIFENRRN